MSELRRSHLHASDRRLHNHGGTFALASFLPPVRDALLVRGRAGGADLCVGHSLGADRLGRVFQSSRLAPGGESGQKAPAVPVAVPADTGPSDRDPSYRPGVTPDGAFVDEGDRQKNPRLDPG